jgi:hypothetical protein
MTKHLALEGVIARRVLVNYRVDPDVLHRLLPPPFRPQRVNGHGVAGICLIRLSSLRPRGVPALLALSSENAAHRIAVEWTAQHGACRRGVYIPRRDSSSAFNAWAGGRLVPGTHGRAAFSVEEHRDTWRIALRGADVSVSIGVRASDHLSSRLFASLDEASTFFADGSVGYSPSGVTGELEGLELRCCSWVMEPLELLDAQSSFFADRRHFPAGTAELDCALLMRDIVHTWHACGKLAA